jgi:hypothetical protein
MASGNITRTPDYTLTSTEDITNEKINRVGGGTYRVDANSITDRELSVTISGGFATVSALRGNTAETFTDGDAIELRGYYSDGSGDFGPPLFYDASDTTTTDNGLNCFVDGNGSRYKRTLTGLVNAEWGGAKGDGTTDDHASMQAILDEGHELRLDYKTYAVSSNLILGIEGQGITGMSGNSTDGASGVPSVLKGTGVVNAVVRIKKRSCRLIGLYITSDSTRYAANITSGHGVLLEDDDGSTSNTSRTYLEDVEIRNQPTDGFHCAGQCELSEFKRVTILDSRRHGFVFDNGTLQGRSDTTGAGFVVNIKQCRAIECAGQGLLAINSQQNFVLDQFESLGCCWDSAQRYSSLNYQVVTTVQGLTMNNPDIEDQQYANTTTTQGNSRTALSSPARGIYIGSLNFLITTPFFSSLEECAIIKSTSASGTILAPRIFAGNYGISQTKAFVVEAGASDIRIRARSQPGYQRLAENQSLDAEFWVDGVHYQGSSYTAYDHVIPNKASDPHWIETGVLSCYHDKCLIRGEPPAAPSAWAISTSYSVGDYVTESTVDYHCVTAHTSDGSAFATDDALGYWEAVAPSSETPDATFWQPATSYSVGDYAQSYWHTEWATAAVYAIHDLVIYHNQAYLCTTAHTAGTFTTDLAANKWRLAFTNKLVTLYCDNAHTSSATSAALESTDYDANWRVATPGPGDTDTIGRIRRWNGGDDGLKGQRMTFIYDGDGYDITWSHGTTNIATDSGGNKTMNASTNTVMEFVYDGSDWVEL